MKFNASVLAIIVGLAHVCATCIDGHREIISPGYTVEYKCDVARLGDSPVTAASENACAELCREAGRSGCTYHPPSKRCVVGAEDGREVKSTGSILMVHVPEPEPEVEDPFAIEDKDPFAIEDKDSFAVDFEAEEAACLARERESEAHGKACLEREKALKAEHAKEKAEKVKVDARLADLMAANYPSQHGNYGVVNRREYRFWCGRHHNPEGYKEEFHDIHTLADCADQCSRRAWCNHVLHGIFQSKCRLYESPKTAAATMPGLSIGK